MRICPGHPASNTSPASQDHRSPSTTVQVKEERISQLLKYLQRLSTLLNRKAADSQGIAGRRRNEDSDDRRRLTNRQVCAVLSGDLDQGVRKFSVGISFS